MSVFTLQKPTAPAIPLIFDSPHSGRDYPDDFHFSCDFKTLQTAEDSFVEELFTHVTNHGATFLHAHFPRSYIDVNRRADDIEPDLLGNDWDAPFPLSPSSRAHAGIGLIRRLVTPGVPVYDHPLRAENILHRIENYYRPYHTALEHALKDAHYAFGQVLHINCHSMPSNSAYPRRGIGLVGNTPKPVDFVLGDRDGTSCDPAITRDLRDFIRDLGYAVSINDPFKGVELIHKYSSPTMGYNAIQIEINKALYMDEESLEKNSNYNHFQADLERITQFCATLIQSRLVNLAAD